MILQGFEVENWTCIKKLTVSGLPSSGVIVLYGPNRQGKSSLVKALRACLMDYASTTNSKALTDSYPRGSGEKPTVTITFHHAGTSYRIKKYFGTNKSELASRTSSGDWRVETTTASDAHDRVCEMAGGNDSEKGLHQLLWLTQAEFRLPAPTKFDANVQARLRGILGVLQTPLDDRFLDAIREQWNQWHSGQRKAGKKHPIKDGCRLAQDLGKLVEAEAKLEQSDSQFRDLEIQIRQASELEVMRSELTRRWSEQTRESRRCEEERERCQFRIAARRLAEERYQNAKKERTAAIEEDRRRIEVVQRLAEAEKDVLPAKRSVDDFVQIMEKHKRTSDLMRQSLGEARKEQRILQQRADRVATKLKAIDNVDQIKVARAELERAESITREIDSTKNFLTHNPVPEKKGLDELKANHLRIFKLKAARDAASMTLRIVPQTGAPAAQLALDGEPPRSLPGSPAPLGFSVRRQAELEIPGWGRVELGRGTGGGSLDQIERDLIACEHFHDSELASYGIAADEPDAFDQLLRQVADHESKNKELLAREKEFKKSFPKGIEPLRRRVLGLETKLKDDSKIGPEEVGAMPEDRDGLDRLQANLGSEVSILSARILSLEKDLEAVDANSSRGQAEVANAKERLAGFEATVKNRREELERLRTEDLIKDRLDLARVALLAAEDLLRDSELTAEESTVDDRLATSKEAVNAIEKQIREIEEKYNRIKGRLEGSEGLHGERAALGAKVDELTRLTKSQKLERDAVDRLYELFEECREKQLGTLMGPIHDRVLNWMRVLDIGDYKEVRFSDAFLPDKLVRRDGTGEIGIGEESTGAQEQIGMLVRVALGSLLTKTDEPAVAVLDDPLTHCDVGRLNKMRGILRRASEGDAKLTPPAGPLQILLLTCHPEWFRDDRATVIDLEDPEVMQRFGV